MINWTKHYKNGLLALGIMLTTSALYNAQDAQGDPNKGAELFKANCTACHTLDSKLIGPPLKGIVERLESEEGLGKDWLHKWIKDSKSVIASGDKYANKIFEENGKVEMQLFPNLSDQDIDDILAYTSNPPAETPKADATAGAEGDKTATEEPKETTGAGNEIVMVSFLAIAGLLVWILFKIRQLVKLNQSEELAGLNETRIQSFGELYSKYKYVGKGLVVVLAFLAGYGVWNWLMWIGVYKGYKPEQPIYFSHKIHAGINKIDCQLCHSGAKYGKVSEIPSLNVCMNCHKAIPEYKGEYLEPGHDRDFYNEQIKTLYTAVGWDPSSMSYTGKTQPIEWTRIHNMPDFVYFNHSQHVVAGEQAIINSYNKKHPNDQIDVVCKACHGKVDTMNVVQMANDFTMGWCIECHRTTEVDMGNAYNEAYFEKLHNKLKKQYGSGAKITVDAIGGLECGKCHY
ncbi:c-type cytochrome [Elizabethkingia sp. JS20170427COW]|uniref:c-type cytochrome n=1 Tax=Elizabethkingia sp. JS20170427COW TaxID=2583851 RepID=UPI00111083C0|nr:c-type cytochrome [Elizabethkingia sp. JS20170427COW]QCX53275.1 c-type cytochrome [Elizabethkingia sp. JS20170427COW]